MKAQPNELYNLPPRLTGLAQLAENMWWSWNPAARMLFKSLDRQAWKESIHNPDKMLKELPSEIMERAAVDEDYLRHYDVVMDCDPLYGHSGIYLDTLVRRGRRGAASIISHGSFHEC